MTDRPGALAAQVAMHQALADQDRADAHRFRTYAAVPTDQRPPMPPIPADIRRINPETIWPALDPAALELLALLADQGAATHDATIRDLTARHQHPKRPR